MKKICVLLAMIFCLIAMPCFAQDYNTGSVNLAWDAPNTGGPVEGYRIYKGTETGVYEGLPSAEISDLNVTISGLTQGVTYYFVCKAYNEAGESDPSNEVSKYIPFQAPGVPRSLREIP